MYFVEYNLNRIYSILDEEDLENCKKNAKIRNESESSLYGKQAFSNITGLFINKNNDCDFYSNLKSINVKSFSFASKKYFLNKKEIINDVDYYLLSIILQKNKINVIVVLLGAILTKNILNKKLIDNKYYIEISELISPIDFCYDYVKGDKKTTILI